MRVVAAKFSERSQAAAALERLQDELQRDDVQLAPLGHPGEPTGRDALVAGRFPDELVPAAESIVERAGGVVVVNIDERWTGMNAASTPPTQSYSSATSRPSRRGRTATCKSMSGRLS